MENSIFGVMIIRKVIVLDLPSGHICSKLIRVQKGSDDRRVEIKLQRNVLAFRAEPIAIKLQCLLVRDVSNEEKWHSDE